ncbi:hypothetical protein LUZ60_015347 [Juncus effusus]|nr:hypothetical protein LUZ60_015347 [Juncus effusus]
MEKKRRREAEQTLYIQTYNEDGEEEKRRKRVGLVHSFSTPLSFLSSQFSQFSVRTNDDELVRHCFFLQSPRLPPMTTMSDDGDRTCPLCAEEMDITDQQLKPCKCGYEICVWCWHHIMEMAEKEETEGRCPACRTRYDKDRIVKMAANAEKMVAEFAAEKKQKPQKTKAKSTSIDARNHLSSVRVIQRNLVYIIGLPNNLMDESLLERREYFGQYGKVMKVSISRPTGAAAQQALVNNTFSVYITYLREEEAVRCIQAVHNFILEGKSLRACFGTTKYCHQWLRNLSCNNPDCLYLHDIGSQEDSFTKDEIISAYTRSRVPQIVLNASLRRAGSILPPPADDFPSISNPVPTKPPLKNGSNSVATTQVKISPPNSSSGKSTLPTTAAWGLRNLSSRPAAVPSSVGPSNPTLIKQKSDTTLNINSNTSLNPNINTKQTSSAWHDDVIPSTNSTKIPETKTLERKNLEMKSGIYRSGFSKELDIDLTDIPSAWNDDPPIVSSKSYSPSQSTKVSNPNLNLNSNSNSNSNPIPNSNSNSNSQVSTSPLPKLNSSFTTQSIEPTSDCQDISARLSSVCLDTELNEETLLAESETLLSSSISNNRSHTPGLHDPGLANHSHTPGLHEPGLPNHSHTPGLHEPTNNYSHTPDLHEPTNNYSHTPGLQEPTNNYSHTPGLHEPTTNYNPLALRDNSSILPTNGFDSTLESRGKTVNTEESNIISDILSLDFDPWDESASLSNNLTAPWRCKSTGQSRFLFARQEDLLEGSGTGNFGYQNFSSGNNSINGGIGFDGAGASVGFARNGPVAGNNARTKVSAPPGFSTPSRAIPPPGFASHDRSSPNHFYDTTYSDNRILENQYRNSPDLEFIDPAILAVGKGRISNEPGPALNVDQHHKSMYHFSNSSPSNTDPRIHMLMQQALASPSQNPRMSDQHVNINNSYLGLNDGINGGFNGNYGGSRYLGQNYNNHQVAPHQHQRGSQLWDGWSDLRMNNNNSNINNNIGMSDILRSNNSNGNLYGGSEEGGFHLPGQNDLFNRAFGL